MFESLKLEIFKAILIMKYWEYVVFCPMKLLVPDFEQYIGDPKTASKGRTALGHTHT